MQHQCDANALVHTALIIYVTNTAIVSLFLAWLCLRMIINSRSSGTPIVVVSALSVILLHGSIDHFMIIDTHCKITSNWIYIVYVQAPRSFYYHTLWLVQGRGNDTRNEHFVVRITVYLLYHKWVIDSWFLVVIWLYIANGAGCCNPSLFHDLLL